MSEHSFGPEDETVPQEEAHREMVDDELKDLSTHAAIVNPGSPGSGYVQAEAVAVRNAVVDILEVLRDAGLIPAS